MNGDVERVMEKLNKANKLMEDLIDMAMDDEKITLDEKDMLFSVNQNLAQYARLIIESVSDGEVDEDELHNLKELENKIVTDAHLIATSDNYISDDERKMLNQLVSVIQSI